MGYLLKGDNGKGHAGSFQSVGDGYKAGFTWSEFSELEPLTSMYFPAYML